MSFSTHKRYNNNFGLFCQQQNNKNAFLSSALVQSLKRKRFLLRIAGIEDRSLCPALGVLPAVGVQFLDEVLIADTVREAC